MFYRFIFFYGEIFYVKFWMSVMSGAMCRSLKSCNLVQMWKYTASLTTTYDCMDKDSYCILNMKYLFLQARREHVSTSFNCASLFTFIIEIIQITSDFNCWNVLILDLDSIFNENTVKSAFEIFRFTASMLIRM